jgi:hypothetical protein
MLRQSKRLLLESLVIVPFGSEIPSVEVFATEKPCVCLREKTKVDALTEDGQRDIILGELLWVDVRPLVKLFYLNLYHVFGLLRHS